MRSAQPLVAERVVGDGETSSHVPYIGVISGAKMVPMAAGSKKGPRATDLS